MRRSQQHRRRFSSDSDVEFEDDEDELQFEEELHDEAYTARQRIRSLMHNNFAVKRCFPDVVLFASGASDSSNLLDLSSIPAHRDVLRGSPVFKAMLENEMVESISGRIKISDVSYDALQAFVKYLYTARAFLDEHMACDLLVLAEKYQVKQLKTYCEEYLMSILNWENSLPCYAFAHQHGAKSLLDVALSLIMDNMDKLSKREEYMELVEEDPRVVVEIYEAYLAKQVNTAASKDPAAGEKSLLDAALSLIMDNTDKLSNREEYMDFVEKDPRVVVEIYEAYLAKQVNTPASKHPVAKT